MGNRDQNTELEDGTTVLDNNTFGSDHLDLTSNRDITPGEPVTVTVEITAPFNNRTTVLFEFRSDDSDPPTTVVISSEEIAIATLVAGYAFQVILPSNGRYLRLRTTGTGGTANTTGRARVHVGQANHLQTNRRQGPGI